MTQVMIILDPECEEVEKFTDEMDDEMMVQSGVSDEVWHAFRVMHIGECEHCQEFAAANFEPQDPTW